VYDDTSGLPITGAIVSVLEAGGENFSGNEANNSNHKLTGERGNFSLALPSGKSTLRISKDGYTHVYRSLHVEDNQASTTFNARLTPLQAPRQIQPYGNNILSLGGTTELTAEGGASITIAPTALGETESIYVQPLSGQGLPGPLPLGWSPIKAYLISTESMTEVATNDVITLTLPGVSADLIAARWSPEMRAWVRLPAQQFEGTENSRPGIQISIGHLGTVAVLIPDSEPVVPPLVDIGDVITGVNPLEIPELVESELLPIPAVLFYKVDTHSDVSATLRPENPLPSGTPVEVVFSESYERIDGSHLVPRNMTQQFNLYQTTTEMVAQFVASPSVMFGQEMLKQGVIHLSASQLGNNSVNTVIGSGGGTVTTAQGASFTIPAGALLGRTPVSLIATVVMPNSLSSEERFSAIGQGVTGSPVAGFQLELSGEVLPTAGTLELTLSQPIPTDTQLLAVRIEEIDEVSKHVLVALGRVNDAGQGEGTQVTFADGGTGLPLPGIDRGGQYYLVRALEPIAFITGAVTENALPIEQALVETSNYPLASFLRNGQQVYVLASGLGEQTLSGLGLDTGSRASVMTNLVDAGEIVSVDLALTIARPTVIGMLPADGSIGADVTTAITVHFSQPMNPDSINATSFKLLRDGIVVNGAVTATPDGLSAIFRPASALAENTLFQVTLANAIEDSYGHNLFGDLPDESFIASFTTVDNTPPERPEAGRISLSIPELSGGETKIVGTVGTAEPNTVVVAINVTTGVTTTVEARNDGSFEIRLPAANADYIELLLIDSSGNEQRFDPGRFTSLDGSVVIGSMGGTIVGPEGISAIVPEGALPDGTLVKIDVLQEEDTSDSELPLLEFLGGVDLDIGGVIATKEIKLIIPVPLGASLDSEDQILVLEQIQFDGEKQFSLANIAKSDGEIIQTNSPPFEGAVRKAKYFFYKTLEDFTIIRLETPFLSITRMLSIGTLGGPVLYTTPGYHALSAYAQDREFDVTEYGNDGSPIYQVSYQPLFEPGYTTIQIPDPLSNDLPLEVLNSFPQKDSYDIQIDPQIKVFFNKEIDCSTVTEDHVQLIRLDPALYPQVGEVYLGDQIPHRAAWGLICGDDRRSLTFFPARRLQHGETYNLQISGICPFGGIASSCGEPLDENIPFSTFQPISLGSIDVDTPSDLAIIDDNTIVVANGVKAGGDPIAGEKGVILIDVSDPTQPEIIGKEKQEGSNTTAVEVVNVPTKASVSGPLVLTLTGGVNAADIVRVYQFNKGDKKNVGSSLEFLGKKYLNTGFGIDIPIPGIPFETGWSRDFTVRGGEDIFVGTIGQGIHGLKISAILDEDPIPPPLARFDSLAHIEAMDDKLLVSEGDSLGVFNLNLQGDFQTISSERIRARYSRLLKGYPVDVNKDDSISESEKFDLIFAVTNDQKLYILNKADNYKIVSKISFAIFDAFISFVDFNPAERVAYVSGYDGTFIVDIDNPFEGVKLIDQIVDSVDDRILGYFKKQADASSGTTELEKLPGGEIRVQDGGKLAYSASRIDRSVHVIQLTNPRLRVIDPNCESALSCSGQLLKGVSDQHGGQSATVDLGSIETLEELVVSKVDRQGAVADGTTELVLLLKLNYPSEHVTFSLVSKDKAFDFLDRDFEPVATKQLSDGAHYAFLKYKLPDGIEGDQRSYSQIAYDFDIEARVGENDNSVYKTPFSLYRRPVLLIHGLWANPCAWTSPIYSFPGESFVTALLNRGFDVFPVDYSSTKVGHPRSLLFSDYSGECPLAATDGFDLDRARQLEDGYLATYDVLLDTIAGVKAKYRAKRIAVTNVDIVGHSMGGIISRGLVNYSVADLASKSLKYYKEGTFEYLRKNNFYQGDISRLITIGTPHFGSPLANKLIENRCNKRDVQVYRNVTYKLGTPVPEIVLRALDWAYEWDSYTFMDFFAFIGKPFGNAVVDLQQNSPAVLNLGDARLTTHLISTDAEPTSSDKKVYEDILFPIFRVEESFLSIFGSEGNDTIVPLSSQRAGVDSQNDQVSTVQGPTHGGVTYAFDKGIISTVGQLTSPQVFQRLYALLLGIEGSPTDWNNLYNSPPTSGGETYHDGKNLSCPDIPPSIPSDPLQLDFSTKLTINPDLVGSSNLLGVDLGSVEVSIEGDQSEIIGAVISVDGEIYSYEGHSPYVVPNVYISEGKKGDLLIDVYISTQSEVDYRMQTYFDIGAPPLTTNDPVLNRLP
ncbi:MAG: hypothetical protein DRR42_10635, partial [Gammaproteobacteria bacterium]